MFDFLANEGVEEKAQGWQEKLVTESQKISEDMKFGDKYPVLVAGLESSDPQEQYRSAYTVKMMKNQADFIRGAVRSWGESTVVAKLGDVAPRIMDVVRVFAPNTIAHIVANAQPLSQLTGQVIVIKPRFTDSAGGVTSGEEVFRDQTDGTYASEENTQNVGTGDAVQQIFTYTLSKVRPSSLTVTAAGITGTDDGSGNITGAGITAGVNSYVNYDTGDFSVEFTAAPAMAVPVVVTYNANTEEDAESIRELELGLNIIPVTAKAHPLRLVWSVASQLAATAAIGLDVEDTLSVVAGQFLKIERDRQLIRAIAGVAGSVLGSLTFSAAPVAALSRREVFNDFIITLAKAQNEIFISAGRGSVSWIIAGTTACVVLQSLKNFVAAPNIVPIGAHVIGTVDNVTIIKDPYMTPAGDFLVGYNGILPGDSGVIIADWIPVYFTPTVDVGDLRGRKALLSMYDIVFNMTTYYKRGTITGV